MHVCTGSPPESVPFSFPAAVKLMNLLLPSSVGQHQPPGGSEHDPPTPAGCAATAQGWLTCKFYFLSIAHLIFVW